MCTGKSILTHMDCTQLSSESDHIAVQFLQRDLEDYGYSKQQAAAATESEPLL
jgi:hypothetical protein